MFQTKKSMYVFNIDPHSHPHSMAYSGTQTSLSTADATTLETISSTGRMTNQQLLDGLKRGDPKCFPPMPTSVNTVLVYPEVRFVVDGEGVPRSTSLTHDVYTRVVTWPDPVPIDHAKYMGSRECDRLFTELTAFRDHWREMLACTRQHEGACERCIGLRQFLQQGYGVYANTIDARGADAFWILLAPEHLARSRRDMDLWAYLWPHANRHLTSHTKAKEASAPLDPQLASHAESKPGCGGCGKVQDGMKKCSRCKAVWFCSKECQARHWPIHKLSCALAPTLADCV